MRTEIKRRLQAVEAKSSPTHEFDHMTNDELRACIRTEVGSMVEKFGYDGIGPILTQLRDAGYHDAAEALVGICADVAKGVPQPDDDVPGYLKMYRESKKRQLAEKAN